MTYIIVFFSVLLLFFIQTKNNYKITNHITLGLFILLSGLSYTNGWDWYGYKNYYDSITSRGFSEVIAFSKYGIEFMFLFYMYIISLLGFKFTSFVFLNAVITNIIIYLSIKRLNLNYTLFMLLFFCVSYLRLELSTLRQGLAVSICLYSIGYILENKKLHFVIFILIASLFHRSAAFLILFYPLFFYHTSIRSHVYIMLMALPMTFLTGYMSNFLSQNYMLFYNEWTKFFLLKLGNYLSLSSGPAINFQSLFLLAGYAFFIFIQDKESKEKELLLKITAGEVFLVFYLSFLPQLVILRLIYYFQVGWIGLCVLNYYYGIKPKRFFLFVLIAIFSCKLILNFRYSFDREVFMPYYNIISFYYHDDDNYGRSHEFLSGKAVEAEEVR